MTKQDTYDIVVAHLRQQGRKSEISHGKCKYRGPNGTKCAAGCLIPDDKYQLRMEGQTVWSGELEPLMEELGHDIGLVSKLQGIHDYNKVEEWEREFLQLAIEHELKYRPGVALATI